MRLSKESQSRQRAIAKMVAFGGRKYLRKSGVTV